MLKLYSTGCPKCLILEKKLNAKHLDYEIINDVQEMRKLKILSVPVLEVDGEKLDFPAAVEWVNAQEVNKCKFL